MQDKQSGSQTPPRRAATQQHCLASRGYLAAVAKHLPMTALQDQQEGWAGQSYQVTHQQDF